MDFENDSKAPWTPGGRSPNPGGRPKGLAKRVREKVGNDGDELIDFFLSVKAGKEKGFTGRDRLDAAKWLSERGWGKTPDTVVSIDGGELDAESDVALSLDELVNLARAPKADDKQPDPTSLV